MGVRLRTWSGAEGGSCLHREGHETNWVACCELQRHIALGPVKDKRITRSEVANANRIMIQNEGMYIARLCIYHSANSAVKRRRHALSISSQNVVLHKAEDRKLEEETTESAKKRSFHHELTFLTTV